MFLRSIRSGSAIALMFLSPLAVSGASFATADIFASYANGKVGVYDSSGAFVTLLNTTTSGPETGSVSDSSGNFYVTDFGASTVTKFDNTGTRVGTFGSGYGTPEDIAFDSAGNAYVGNLNGTIRKFSSTGTFLNSFATGRTDWFDLSSDLSTAYYTDESGAIHRQNLLTNTALSNFASSGGQFALRILTDGGILAASAGQVTRFNSAGGVVRTYSTAGTTELFALNLENDGTSFITGDVASGKVFRFDIASGALLQTIQTDVAGNGGALYGLSVSGERTVSNPGTPEPGTIVLLSAGLVGIVVRYRKIRLSA